MKTRGINRIVVGVRDLDEAVARYSRLLGAEFSFVPLAVTERFGSRVAISWEAQLELVQALPGIDGYGLLPKADGLMGVIYNCDDVETARKVANDMGAEVLRTIEMNQEQIDANLGGRHSMFLEYSIGPGLTDGVPTVLAQIEEKVAAEPA